MSSIGWWIGHSLLHFHLIYYTSILFDVLLLRCQYLFRITTGLHTWPHFSGTAGLIEVGLMSLHDCWQWMWLPDLLTRDVDGGGGLAALYSKKIQECLVLNLMYLTFFFFQFDVCYGLLWRTEIWPLAWQCLCGVVGVRMFLQGIWQGGIHSPKVPQMFLSLPRFIMNLRSQADEPTWQRVWDAISKLFFNSTKLVEILNF